MTTTCLVRCADCQHIGEREMVNYEAYCAECGSWDVAPVYLCEHCHEVESLPTDDFCAACVREHGHETTLITVSA